MFEERINKSVSENYFFFFGKISVTVQIKLVKTEKIKATWIN